MFASEGQPNTGRCNNPAAVELFRDRDWACSFHWSRVIALWNFVNGESLVQHPLIVSWAEKDVSGRVVAALAIETSTRRP